MKSADQLTLFPELPAASRRSARRARFFFALWPDQGLRERLTQAAAILPIGDNPSAYRVKPERIHLTLAFLGTLDTHGAEAALLAGAAVQARAFTLALDKVGHFSGPNVVWIGPSALAPPLAKLKGELDRELLRFALPVESAPYRPHVTCLRNVREPPDASLVTIEWCVQDFVLVRSAAGSGGKPARYRVLRRWPLQQAGAA